jgi:hypothetical protein
MRSRLAGAHWSCCATALLVIACNAPSDVIFQPQPFTPVADRDGRLRVTFASTPDVGRGFLPDGRLLFRAIDLPAFGDGWVLVSVPPDGGELRQEAGPYQPAVRDGMSDLEHANERRALVLWRTPVQGVHGCPSPAPPPATPVAFTVFTLPAEDGTAISNLPSRYIETNGVFGAGTLGQLVRVTPSLRDVNATGGDAFGPVPVPGTDSLIYSDGERIWIASLVDTAAPPVMVTDGAYPAVAPDGRTLAFSRPVGVDSVTQTYVVPVGIAACVQEHVEIFATAWEVVLRDLATGDERVVAEGLDPAFDPLLPRLVVRQGGALAWVDLGSGAATPIAATGGAFDPAVSPNGDVLAFSLFTSPGNSDVYFLRTDR